MATLKNDLSLHNLTLEDAIKLALDKPLWRLLAASGATHWWCMPNNDDIVAIFVRLHAQTVVKFWPSILPTSVNAVVVLQAPVQLYYSSSGLSFLVDEVEDAVNLPESWSVANGVASRSATTLQWVVYT